MKILLVASDLSIGGGVTRVIANLAHILVGFPDVRVHVLHSRPFQGFRYAMPKDVTLIEGSARTRLAALDLMSNLLRARWSGYDHVISFWTQENLAVCVAFAGSRGRVIVCEHLSHDQAPKRIAVVRRWIYRLAHRVLVLNESEYTHYRRTFERVTLIPNAAVEQPTLGIDFTRKDNLVIGIGHLTKRKGFDNFVRACVRADIFRAGWRAVIIGDGPEQADLEELIASLGASGYISIRPSTERIVDWYMSAKVLVVPSLTEVFSMVLAESMAHGVVPLAFATDGPKDILRMHPDHLFEIGDTEGLARALARTICDPQLQDKAARMQNEAIARFSKQAVATLWDRLLHDV